MSNLHPLEAASKPSHGTARILYLRARADVEVSFPNAYVPKTSTSASGDTGGAQGMALEMTSLDEQIAQMEAMAKQHYPDDEIERNGYMVKMLMQRLREYHAKFLRLEVRHAAE